MKITIGLNSVTFQYDAESPHFSKTLRDYRMPKGYNIAYLTEEGKRLTLAYIEQCRDEIQPLLSKHPMLSEFTLLASQELDDEVVKTKNFATWEDLKSGRVPIPDNHK